jgi:hypothetical protein
MYQSMSPALFVPIGKTSSGRPLRDDADYARSQIYVGHVGVFCAVPQAAHALESHAGVQGKPDDREVPPVAEVLPTQLSSKRQTSPSGSTGTGFSGIIGGRVFLIGDAWISPSSSSHLKSC